MRITYICLENLDTAPGIKKKAANIVASLNRLGHDASVDYPPKQACTPVWFLRLFLLSRDLLVIRIAPHSRLNYLLLPALLFARLRNVRVVAEIPTPLCVASHEIQELPAGRLIKLLLRVQLHLLFPLSVIFTHRILQYSHESKWFSLYCQKKTKLISNSIDCDAIPPRTRHPAWPADFFSIIVVANTSHWHGIDRIIAGIREHAMHKHSTKVVLNVVGEGTALPALKLLANDPNTEGVVHFHGVLTGDALQGMYCNSHVAAATLGGHRKHMSFSSDLKSREYCAAGIPFISSQIDPDFDCEFRYRCQIPQDDSPIDISFIIDWYHSIQFNSQAIAEMARHARNRLTFSTKADAFVQ